jgi:hypothetical protein
MRGTGGEAQIHVSQQIRVTVNANGKLRAEALRTRVNCRA